MDHISNPYNNQEQPQMGRPMTQHPLPIGRRARWNKRLMSGSSMGLQSLPDWFATYAVVAYAIALVGVSIIRSSYAMEWYFGLFGIVWVAGFFYLSAKFSRDWNVLRIKKAKGFESRLFQTGLWMRVMYVLFIHYFYLGMTGSPYEFQKADTTGYIELAGDWATYMENGTLWTTLIETARSGISDMGYPLFELLPIRWFGEDAALIVLRLLNALLGSYTAVLVYRIVYRAMGDTVARIAAIFCMLHPVLICYSGILLKEVLMTFLVVLFIDLGDRLLRNRSYTLGTIAPMILVGVSLFFFRTVLGMIAFLALFFALVMMSNRIVSLGKKITLGVIIAGVLLMSASDTIMQEIDQITQTDVREQQKTSLEMRYGEKKGGGGGNAFAKYAGTAVFAPLIFTIPFPTMVKVEDQEDMRLIHGGNWMRNVLSGFVILAMFMLLLSGDWRRYTLPLAMLLGYLLMLAFTQFAHSLRFHIPVMPFEMMFAAYAIANMRKKHRNWYLIWCVLMVAACFAWNWFKLAGRGLA